MNDAYTISPSGQVYEEWKILSHPKPAKNPTMSNMPFVEDPATGVLVPTPGTDEDVVKMFYTLMQNFSSRGNNLHGSTAKRD